MMVLGFSSSTSVAVHLQGREPSRKAETKLRLGYDFARCLFGVFPKLHFLGLSMLMMRRF